MLRAGRVLVAVWLAVLFTAGAAQAAGATVPGAATGAAAAAPGGTADAAVSSPAAYLAEQLRRSPVYVTDELPRAVPRSTAPEFAALARRLGVPTYVVVLPGLAGGLKSGLLAGIHDHLGRKGLYVALSEAGLTDVQTYGLSVPGAQDAATATRYELPYDATARESFRRFVDVLTSGDAHQRAEQAREAYGGAQGSHEPPALHTTRTDRENESFLTGVVVTGVPLAALLIGGYGVRRWRLRRERSGAGAARPAHRARLILLLAAPVLAGLLAFTAAQVFDATSSGDGSVPTAADMRARLDRIAAGLHRDPLYTDPETPADLDAAARTRLRARLAALPVPVLVAVVPTSLDDESGGSGDRLLASLHDRLRRDAVFVLADPVTGELDVANYGTRLDTGALSPPTRDSEPGQDPAEQLGPRLDALLASAARLPMSPTAHEPFNPGPVEDPVAQQTLPGLFTGDFWPGLVIGALTALLFSGLVLALWALVRWLCARTAVDTTASPTQPKPSWLRRTAATECTALGAELERSAELPEAARLRPWECLDAATLLIDGDSDGRPDADADSASLACAIVLARAGRAVVAEPSAADHVCYRNPLHGPAGKPERRHPGRRGAPPRPVCAACRETPGEMLRLHGSDGFGRRGYAPYPVHSGPLARLAQGATIDQLTREVRESFGVH
ncbi:hypothetical protein ADL22_27200 [Streptomyces sp. NRRL F-4489]|uniref:hypothetical protein n=1 Tax=Streptomyces sp. NRRL F-4489 TaxID=1609095 RepID=UPI000746E3F7|nr:hypothetical protein [Streptomyces sp. NRRL F-4489]KUL35537.1 hypothetical protein ADL22_27200 [Streptomyces sp. NRRL F-4489]